MMIQLVNYPFNSSVAHRPRRASEALTPPTPGVTEIGATGGDSAAKRLFGRTLVRIASSFGVKPAETSSVRGEMFPTL